MEIEIRDLRPTDVDGVHEILVSESTIAGSMRLPFQARYQTEKRLEPGEGYTRLVALDGEDVVGFIELLTYPQIARHNHVGHINLVAVKEGYQGEGIGRRLMEAVIDLSENWLQVTRLELMVWTTNDRAVRLYKSLGFEQEGTHRDYVFSGGRYLDAFTMARLRPGWGG